MLTPTTEAELNRTANRLLFWKRPVIRGELRRAVPVAAAVITVIGTLRKQRQMGGRKRKLPRRAEMWRFLLVEEGRFEESDRRDGGGGGISARLSESQLLQWSMRNIVAAKNGG